MHLLIRFCLALTVLSIIVHCQGARGGGGGGGGSRGGGSAVRTGSGSQCTGDDCKTAGIIAGSVIGGIFGTVAIVFGSIFCYRRCRGKPQRSNAAFVTDTPSNQNQIYSKAYFETGTWSSRYHQYNRWHGPHQFSLTFDPSTSKVDGEGTDDIGTFTIDGTYSCETNRLALTKMYKSGTGNTMENFGHQATIQLEWNADHNQFEGKWYIQTNTYRGEDKFELKLEQSAESVFEKPDS